MPRADYIGLKRIGSWYYSLYFGANCNWIWYNTYVTNAMELKCLNSSTALI